MFTSLILVILQSLPLKSQSDFQIEASEASPNWSIDRISINDGLSQRSVGALVSDRQGFLWIGTEDGLNRYDGFEFKIFKNELDNPNSISSSWINCIVVDSLDNLWIGTNDGLNYFDKKTEAIIRYHHIPTDSTSLSNSHITRLTMDRHGSLWVGTKNGLNVKTRAQSTFTRFNNEPSLTAISGEHTVHGLLIDSKDRIWVGKHKTVSVLNIEGAHIEEHNSERTPFSNLSENLGNTTGIIEDGSGTIWIGGNYLYYYNELAHEFVKFNLNDDKRNYISTIFKDVRGDLWIGKKKLFHLKKPDDLWQLEVFKEELQSNKSVSLGSYISSFTEDVNGHLWMGAWAGGLSKFKYRPERFYNLQHDPYGNNKEQLPPITGLYVDADENIWIGTWGAGLLIWDRKSENYINVQSSDDYRKDIESKVITNIFGDKEGLIWICTYNSGLYKIDPVKKRIINYDHDPNDPNSISASYLSYIYEDSRRQIWVSTKFNGLCKLNSQTETFKVFKNDPGNPSSISSDQVRAIVEDKYTKQLWIGTMTGGLNRYDHEKNTFTSFQTDQDDPNSLPSNLISELFVDSKNRLWVGTVSGLCRMSFDKPGYFTRYSMKDGLPNDVIYAIEEDDIGRLWISTNAGITCFDTEKEKFINYGVEDGLLDKEYNGLVSSKIESTGELIFGSVKSATIFQPSNFGLDTTHAPLIITNYSRHNSTEVKGKAIEDLFVNPDDDLSFNYNDKIITLQIASLNYTNSDQIKYQYHLEGFSKEWYDLGQNREIVLTNLDPGNYTLFAKATNQDEVWCPPQKMISFEVHPPWYATSMAYLSYALLLLALGYGIYKIQKRRWGLQTQLQLEQAEAERLKELDIHKNNLFANITHEFRTPLTLILGLTQQLKKSPRLGLQKKLGVIERNGKQLLSLVNQMLDLTKLETGNVTADYVNGDIMAYLGYLIESYQSFAISNQKSLSYFCYPKSLTMDYAPEMMYRIVENLLSNALKFTNKYGQIKVELTVEHEMLKIEVADNGRGISLEHLPHIFDRFYQADSSSIRDQEGTGLGLALVKELVDLLDGTISVISKPEIGSTFKITLPITNDAPNRSISREEIKAHVSKSTNLTLLSSPDEKTDHNEKEIALITRDERPILLIIEDNNDVINYLKSSLKDEYDYLIGRNGKKGVELALENIPDIIITDLMMPVMDGFEVCERLKQDPRTSHVPIIMLTAKATLEDRLTGLSKGADAYLSKPFNSDELHIRLENLLELRKALQRKLQMQEEDQSDPESAFLQQIRNIIFENLDDENFDVARLCRDIGMSRAQLHRKIKALTDYSTGHFIRLLRLNEAKKLLEIGDHNVSEVADMVGFRHHTNFTIAFKNEYGISPSEV